MLKMKRYILPTFQNITQSIAQNKTNHLLIILNGEG